MEILEEGLNKATKKWLYFGGALLGLEIVFLVMIFAVFPKLGSLYQELGVTLSPGGQILFLLNNFLWQYPLLPFLVVGGQALLWYRLYENGVGPRFLLKYGTLLEPLIMILVGLLVGFSIMALIIPIYNLTQQF